MTIKVTYNVTDVYMSQSVSPVYINVSYSDGGQGIAVWGGITGTLSNQTDLQNALNAKVPYTGATGNVDLGEYELKAGQVEFDQTPTGTAGVGVMRWNDADGTVDLGLKGGNVTLQVGQEQVARVVNKTGANLLESEYKVVKVSSAQGQRLAVDLAQANNDNNSADTHINKEGFITTLGTIRGINTTGSLQGETWTDGDVLYLSGTNAGAITNVKPTAPLHIVVVGYVEYAHQNNGKIFVKVMNGWEIDELHNVLISSPTNNQGLFYNSSNSLWENKSIATALGFTPANAATTLTINGVTFDLSTSRTWTIAAGISGSGASGQVTYWTGASAVSGSNNLFWDNTNGRLGIGTNAPSDKLHVVGTTLITDTLSAGTETFTNKLNGKFGTFGIQSFSVNNGFVCANMFYNSTANSWQRITTGTGYGLQFFNGQLLLHGVATGTGTFTENIKFKFDYEGALVIGNNLSTTQGTYTGATALFTKTGNLILNSSTLDGGQRFQVYGDTLLRGSGNTSATTALTVQNSSSTNLLTVRNDGLATIESVSTLARLSFSNLGNSIISKDTFGTNGLQLTGPNDASHSLTITSANLTSYLNGALSSLRFSGNFIATGGSTPFSYILVNGTINQTNISTSIIRGLYVNPTLTAAADWRSIEWSNNSGWGLYGAGTANNYLAGNLGIAVTPNAWTVVKALQIQRSSFTSYSDSGFASSQFTTNAYYDGSWRYVGTGGAAKYDQQTNNIAHFWSIAPSGTLGNAITFTQAMTLFNTGNLSIGTASDLAVRLGVVGDTLLRGSGATSATTALTVQNSSSTNLFTVRNDSRVGIATNAPTAALDVWNATDNAQVRISDSRVTIPDYSGVGYSPVMSTRTLGFFAPASSSTGGVQFSGFTSNTNTGFPFVFVGVHGGTSPTTSALRFGAWKHNGTTGLTVLTGSEIIAGFKTGNNADVFQVKANGTINMSSLPTSSTGLVAGDLWNDAGTVKIV